VVIVAEGPRRCGWPHSPTRPSREHSDHTDPV